MPRRTVTLDWINKRYLITPEGFDSNDGSRPMPVVSDTAEGDGKVTRDAELRIQYLLFVTKPVSQPTGDPLAQHAAVAGRVLWSTSGS